MLIVQLCYEYIIYSEMYMYKFQLERLQQQMRDMKKEHRKEKEVIVEDFSKQINELEEKLGEKMREVELMQSELKMVKEFRRRRGQMQKELDEVCQGIQQPCLLVIYVRLHFN